MGTPSTRASPWSSRIDAGLRRERPATAARLRLAAAYGVLKLATHKAFAQEVENNLTTLAWLAQVSDYCVQPHGVCADTLVQDPCYAVREGFLTKLVKYLQRRKLVNPNFNLVLFLVAHDPEKEIIQIARASLVRRYRAMPLRACRGPGPCASPDDPRIGLRTMAFELILVRLLRLLAHHPDFSNEAEDILTFAKYIDFYADCIASQENVPLLYHLAGKLKGVRDASQNHTNVRRRSPLKRRSTDAATTAVPLHPL